MFRKYLSNINRIHNCSKRFGIAYIVWDIFLCHFFSYGQQLKMMKLPTRENFGPMKYPREKILDPPNIHEERLWTHETPTRKNLWPTKYPSENILDPRNTHEKNFWTHEIRTNARWHDGTRPTRPTIARDPRNLAHSQKLDFKQVFSLSQLQVLIKIQSQISFKFSC